MFPSLFASPGATLIEALLLNHWGVRPGTRGEERSITVDVLDVEGAFDTRDTAIPVVMQIVRAIMAKEPRAIGLVAADVRHACTLVSVDARVLVTRAPAPPGLYPWVPP